MIVVGSECFVSREADEDDGFRVEPLRLVNGGVPDAVRAGLFLGAFAQVSTCENPAFPERAIGDVGLGVEDEHFRGITEAGFLPAAKDGFDEITSISLGRKRVDLWLGAFRKMVAHPK